jgi:hypothetical protein
MAYPAEKKAKKCIIGLNKCDFRGIIGVRIQILLKIGLKSYIIAKKFAYVKINEYLCIENMSMLIAENPLPYCITLIRST